MKYNQRVAECVLCAGGVRAVSVQEDVGMETMGAAGRGASFQPVEMACLKTPVYTAHTVCVIHTSALVKYCINKSPVNNSPFFLKSH